MPKRGEMTVTPGRILRHYSPEEARVLAEQWLSAFGGRGAPNTRAYMWHAFSARAYPSTSLQEAEAEYLRHDAGSFIVLSNDRDAAVETDVRPISCDEADYYVFPPNMAWTMAITHEDGWLGPYFAKHHDYAVLNQQNIDRIKKLQAIELARQKRWS